MVWPSFTKGVPRDGCPPFHGPLSAFFPCLSQFSIPPHTPWGLLLRVLLAPSCYLRTCFWGREPHALCSELHSIWFSAAALPTLLHPPQGLPGPPTWLTHEDGGCPASHPSPSGCPSLPILLPPFPACQERKAPSRPPGGLRFHPAGRVLSPSSSSLATGSASSTKHCSPPK